MTLSGALCGQIADRVGRRDLILVVCMAGAAVALLSLNIPRAGLAASLLVGIVLNRTEAMNSVDPPMREDLHTVWGRIQADEQIRVAIVTGAGDRAFTGFDRKKTNPPRESDAELLPGSDAPGTMLHRFGTDTPVICEVNGHALGGGMELALACDSCICFDIARSGLAEARSGNVPGSGGLQRLPRVVSKSDRMLMLLTGDMVDPTEEHRISIVSRVVPVSEPKPRARAIALHITANAPLAVRAQKRLVQQGIDMPLPAALEVDKYMLGSLRDTKDDLEGRRAFEEKRKPACRGR